MAFERPPSRAGRPVRVVIADDSRIMQRVLGDAARAAGFEVVGIAGDGAEAIETCRAQRPEVLSLDLSMPGKDGVDVLRELVTTHLPTSVVVVSAFSRAATNRVLDVLAEGATDFVVKPSGDRTLSEFAEEFVAKLQAAAASPTPRELVRARLADGTGSTGVARPRPGEAAAIRTAPVRGAAMPAAGASAGAASSPPRAATRPSMPPPAAQHHRNRDLVLAIASSTGGPRALTSVIPHLPAPCGRGVVIVQHMPEAFTEAFARRLDSISHLNVREAKAGDRLDPMTALVAPGGLHLRFDEHGVAWLSDDPAIGGVRPRADLTIEDLARLYGQRLVLAVLTGMGNDGLVGARAVSEAGGVVMAQSEEDCVVYGMPRHVVEADLADFVLPADEMARAMVASSHDPPGAAAAGG